MSKKLLVGNLAPDVTDDMLYRAFEPHGTVLSALVVLDRASAVSRGFGFVEMKTDTEAWAAMKTLNLQELHGRCMTVTEARPKPNEARRGRRH